MEQRISRRRAGKPVRVCDHFLDRPADRRTIGKIRELWKCAFNGVAAVKNSWEVCEDCWRIRRKRDRKTECSEDHVVWDALGLKKAYCLESVEDLMTILEHIRRDRTGKDGLCFEMPQVPRRKRKAKKGKARQVEEKTPEKSKGEEEGEDEETRE